MKTKLSFFVFLFLGLILINIFLPVLVIAYQTRETTSSEINFFYSTVCPHCKEELKFLDELEKKYPQIKINRYEVIYNKENREILKKFYEQYRVPLQEQGYVPLTFTRTKYFIGFNSYIANQIESCVEECFVQTKNQQHKQIINIPFFGEIDLSKLSLPVLTLVLGTLDGFNPCAMWVLVILISLLLSLKSRKKIALVGGIFIFAEGLLYFLFITVWLNAFLWMKYVYIAQLLIGIFGIGFGIFRIKEFITWKPGVCKVTNATGSQTKIVDKMKKILELEKLPAIVIGIILLALGGNSIE